MTGAEAAKQEVTLLIHATNGAVQGVQWAAISMPTWAHLLVTFAVGGLAAVANRQKVVPNSKIGL